MWFAFFSDTIAVPFSPFPSSSLQSFFRSSGGQVSPFAPFFLSAFFLRLLSRFFRHSFCPAPSAPRLRRPPYFGARRRPFLSASSAAARPLYLYYIYSNRSKLRRPRGQAMQRRNDAARRETPVPVLCDSLSSMNDCTFFAFVLQWGKISDGRTPCVPFRLYSASLPACA